MNKLKHEMRREILASSVSLFILFLVCRLRNVSNQQVREISSSVDEAGKASNQRIPERTQEKI